MEIENSDVKQFIEVTKKEIDKKILFSKSGTFDACHFAENEAKLMGMEIGRMCCDYPIVCAFGVSYIAKWTNIQPKEWKRISALIVPEDKEAGFRDGGAYLLTFKDKE